MLFQSLLPFPSLFLTCCSIPSYFTRNEEKIPYPSSPGNFDYIRCIYYSKRELVLPFLILPSSFLLLSSCAAILISFRIFPEYRGSLFPLWLSILTNLMYLYKQFKMLNCHLQVIQSLLSAVQFFTSSCYNLYLRSDLIYHFQAFMTDQIAGFILISRLQSRLAMFF